MSDYIHRGVTLLFSFSPLSFPVKFGIYFLSLFQSNLEYENEISILHIIKRIMDFAFRFFTFCFIRTRQCFFFLVSKLDI